MKLRMREPKPATVSTGAKQAGEADAEIFWRWTWVEPAVWTTRMLTALEQGVKGGSWFSLIDKVYTPPALEAAFRKVEANRGAAGVDHVTIEMFAANLDVNLRRLAEDLRDGSYRPQLIRRTWIPKPGSREMRPLGIPTVRDRVVQAALRAVLEPIFERDFAEHSYGFRPQRGTKDALRRVDELLKAGYTFVVDADLKSYFDTIPHTPLMAALAAKVSDGRVLALVTAFLEQGVLSEQGIEQPETGTPQGAVLSPLLSNIYLDPLDHLIASRGWVMVRYADDFVILCRSEAEARAALNCVQQWTAQAGLVLHPEKTHVVDATQKGGFDFLGYHFERGYKWPRQKSLKKLKDRLRELTCRTNGQSLDEIIRRINQTLEGWFEYFKHSHKTTFPRLDRWLRMRLRSILRKRAKGKGRGKGKDHFRWPNAFFGARGLFNLSAARAQLCQSSRR
ncbi:MAG: group II intron reverse transcriptase/maturase [Blastocatellia bacterium]